MIIYFVLESKDYFMFKIINVLPNLHPHIISFTNARTIS